MRKYISDIVTEEEINKWQLGQRILINSQTGTGKSHFIKNTLYDYCLANNKKVLLLSNRSILKSQNIEDLENKTNIIHPENYQLLESKILKGTGLEELFESYDFIVFDEAHYLFTDAQFNRNTDLLIEPIINTPKDKILICSTATPDAVLFYQPNFDFTYTIPFDYNYIENIYFYDKAETVNQILYSIPETEKVIYFSSDALDAYDLSTKYENCSFICSSSNKGFSRKIDEKTIEDIVNYNTFYSRILCATKVLDNGVNLIDKNIKHIIIDILDPITLVQCIGRKRVVDEDDKINIYIKNYHGGFLYPVVKELNEKIRIVNELESLGVEEFQIKYKKKDIDSVIQNDFTVNQSKFINYKISRKFYSTMLNDVDKIGYKKMICDMLHQGQSIAQIAEIKFEKIEMIDILENVLDNKLFDEEIEKFRGVFFESIFAHKKVDYRKRGILCANAIMQEDNLPFQIISSQETKGKNRKKRYWMVIRK
jgi:hypothetical protein